MLSMAALLGSVVLHAVAFCSIRLGAVNSVHTVEKEPISVELIELSPIVESRKPVSGAVINSKILPPIASKPITSKGTIPDGEVIAKSQNKVATKPVATRSPQPKPASKPTVAAKPAARSPQPKPAPKTTVAAKPAARSPQPKPTVTPKPVVVRAGSVRAMPYPPASLGDRKPVTPRPPLTPSPKPQPSESPNNGSLVATFDLGSIRSGERDIPDQLAKPLQNQRQFSPVLDPLQIGLRSGSALTFEVLVEIDEEGKLTIIRQVNPVEDGTQRQSGVQSTDYLGFAKELLKNWQFQAAHSGGQAVYSELWLRLTVKAL